MPPEKRQPAFSLGRPPLGAPETAAFDDPGETLPPASGGSRFACVARDPHSIFVYWELALPICRIPGGRLAIAVHREDGSHETTCPLETASGTRFLSVAGANTRYRLALGYLPAGAIARDEMVLLLAERDLSTPRDRPLSEPSRSGSLLGSVGEGSVPTRALLFPESAGNATSGSSH